MPRETARVVPRNTRGGCLVCGARAGAVAPMLIARLGTRRAFWLCGDCAEAAINRQRLIDAYADYLGPDTSPARGTPPDNPADH